MKIIHGMAEPVLDGQGLIGIRTVIRKTGIDIVNLPKHFIALLFDKFEKWGSDNPIPFTVGSTDDYASIAITHPLDNFSRKIGVKIVTGRLGKAHGKNIVRDPKTGSFELGELDRPTYRYLPNTVCKVIQAL